MHEGKHGILDDVDEMDKLFGIDEEAEEGQDIKRHKHDHGHNHDHDDHKDDNK